MGKISKSPGQRSGDTNLNRATTVLILMAMSSRETASSAFRHCSVHLHADEASAPPEQQLETKNTIT